MKNLFSALIIIFFLSSCSTSNDSILEDSAWLNGTWLREYNGNNQIETWSTSNHTMLGKGSFANGVDTTEMVTYQITIDDDQWALITKDVGFENELAYSLSTTSPDSCIFVNNGTEWPQIIKYKKLSTNELEKTISGQHGSMKKEISLTFKKKSN